MEQKQYILSLSYGKDSLACLGAIEELGLPLDRILHAEIWATKTIPADFPEMIAFKEKADKFIKERYGIEVEHIRHKMSYEEYFYRTKCKGLYKGQIKGFPLTTKSRSWCKQLKIMGDLNKKKNIIKYIGIAADEPKRFHVLGENAISPLKEIGWTEAQCMEWCQKNDLLSPIYINSGRGGCWFCHCQPLKQLRILRKEFPEYWNLLLKWDIDSPIPFSADNHTVHDYDKRFALEELDLVPMDKTFRWNMINMTDEELNNIEHNKKVICLDTQKEFNNITEASSSMGIDKRSIKRCANGETKTAGGYHWKYLEEN